VKDQASAVQEAGNGHCVEQRSTVRVRDRDEEGEEEYTMVRSAEADAALGLISVESPVGSALLGRRRGDEVEVQTPGGVRRFTVVDVIPPARARLGEFGVMKTRLLRVIAAEERRQRRDDKREVRRQRRHSRREDRQRRIEAAGEATCEVSGASRGMRSGVRTAPEVTARRVLTERYQRVRAAVLAGSVVRGEATATSDLDR
jgi:Transcription elongation factor, GreA/GreB, C-term